MTHLTVRFETPDPRDDSPESPASTESLICQIFCDLPEHVQAPLWRCEAERAEEQWRDGRDLS